MAGKSKLTSRAEALERLLAHGRGDERGPDCECQLVADATGFSGCTWARADSATAVSAQYKAMPRRANVLDSNALLLDDLVRQCPGEADNRTLGRGVVEKLHCQLGFTGLVPVSSRQGGP